MKRHARWMRAGLAVATLAAFSSERVLRAQGDLPPVEAPPRGAATATAISPGDDIDRLTAEAARLAAEEQTIVARRAALDVRARQQLHWLYDLQRTQPMALRGGPEALMDHAVRIEYVRRAAHNTLAERDALATRATQLVVEKARNAAALEQSRARQSALALHAGVTDRLAVTARIPDNPMGTAESPPVTVYGGAVDRDGVPAPGSFGDAAGRLLFPLAGRAEVRHAQREGADGPGVEILAPLGAPVRAVFPGHVAFADRYGAYGKIVILDHGDHYYTVSANLGAMSVHVGDEVTTGTVIGTVGDDGRGPMLYFEVRHGSDTIDPAPWLGL